MTKNDIDALRRLRFKIRRTIERRDMLRMKTLPGAIRYKPDKLSTPTVFDPMGDIIVEVVELDAELTRLQKQYNDKRVKVCNAIRTQSDKTAAYILCQRYIHGKAWHEIQESLNCGQSAMFRKHSQGIIEMLSTTYCG